MAHGNSETVIGVPVLSTGKNEELGSPVSRRATTVFVTVAADDGQEREEICDDRCCRMCRLRCAIVIFIGCSIILLAGLIMNAGRRQDDTPVFPDMVVVAALVALSVSTIVCVVSVDRNGPPPRRSRLTLRNELRPQQLPAAITV